MKRRAGWHLGAPASRLADPAAAALRRTGWLQATLRGRAANEAYHLTDRARSSGPHPPIQESTREEQERGEIVIAFADPRLAFLGGTAGPFGQDLPDRLAAATALATQVNGAGQTVLTLGDGSRIQLVGVARADSSFFG